MFILTEPTPNPHAQKFIFDQQLVGEGSVWYDIDLAVNSNEFVRKLFRVAGVRFALLQENYVTVTKFPQWEWSDLTKKIKSAVEDETVYIESGETDKMCQDVICCAVRKIMEDEIRPAVQLDGGDIKFIKYEDGVVHIKMQGSCWGCPNHESTLGALTNKLNQKIPEVKMVTLQ
jgi:Fe-S cluster biogenesis protein NfuA